jgi:hypothetical protein
MALSALPRTLFLVAASLSFVILGCGTETPTMFLDASMMDAPTDALNDRRLILNDAGRDASGRVCTRSSQCDDGIECTMDFCTMEGRCATLPDNTMCDNRVYCDGLETCDTRRGCVRGTPISCNDNYTCTLDRCDEATRGCLHSPRDSDRDGDPDIHCRAEGCDAGDGSDASVDVVTPEDGATPVCWIGGDCDETNPRVNSRLPEICGDGIDNNCNGAIDMMEPGGCMRPPYDTCETPLDVSRGGRFTVPIAGTMGNYNFMCAGGMLMRDVVARLRLTETRDVGITTSSTGAAIYVQLMQNQCGTAMMPTDIRTCMLGFPTVIRQRSLPPGDYFILMGTSSGGVAGEIDLQIDLSAPTPVPANDTCTAPTVIPPTGGTFMGDLVGVAANINTRCGGTQPDVVYQITLAAPANVTARVSGSRSDFLNLALVDRCVASPMTLRCDSAAPAQFTARQLPAGTYFFVVSGRTVNPFSLEVTVTPPSPPLQGDVCANPLIVTPGTPVRGNFTDMEADYQLTCSGTGSRDVVYRFDISERRDVTATVRGSASDYFYLAVETTCGERTTERACRFGSPGRLTVRGLDPGTYFLVIKGIRGGDYELTLDATPPVMPTAVMDNDTCMAPAVIPPGGGIFTGNTSMARRDYMCPCSPGSTSEDVVFRYRVNTRQRVNFSTEGSAFDTVMWLTQGATCPGTNVPGGCNDDAIGVASAFDLTLEPGDYYVFVGGFGTASRGNYVLTVTPTTSM